jgi:hypothetical protein
MMKHLWDANTPEAFWQLETAVPPEVWQAAIAEAAVTLCLPGNVTAMSDLLMMTLGEGQFGAAHFEPPTSIRLYYHVKSYVPHGLIMLLRRALGRRQQSRFLLGWPHEDRYARFLWRVMRGVLVRSGCSELGYRPFWPGGARFALVLTHDVETARGMDYVRAVADMDEAHGFRSCFNLVPERYPIDGALVDELRRHGFEVGIHGLTHDGRLFTSHRLFAERAARINHYLHAYGAVGFRAPFVMRHPQWLQALDVEYDASFFDTDPYQPVPGGTMSLWPFFLGRFVELPYTLSQDCVLDSILHQRTPEIWLRKVDLIARYRGMALVNTHPDYLSSPTCGELYRQFLAAMRVRHDAWHALPYEVARWWRQRAAPEAVPEVWGSLTLDAAGGLLVDGVAETGEGHRPGHEPSHLPSDPSVGRDVCPAGRRFQAPGRATSVAEESAQSPNGMSGGAASEYS